MPGHDIIVVGASAGGVEALTRLVAGLPGDLAAAIFVVLHVPAHGTSLLPQILSRSGRLSARHPDDGEAIEPGRIYVAPPDLHLLLGRDRVRLSRGPRENGHRPAVDTLFRTAARSHGRRVVGVVLSGALDDGAAGLTAVKVRGGTAIVQAPDDALYPGMPRSALEMVDVDLVLPAVEIPAALERLVSDPSVEEGGEPVPDDMEIESEIAAFDLNALQNGRHPGTPSGFACPDCGGSLWELHEGSMVRFRCRVGHAWSPNGLLAEQVEAMETALWTALRALEERASLAARLASRMRRKGNTLTAHRFEEQEREAKHRAAIIRQILISEPRFDSDFPPPALTEPTGSSDTGASNPHES